MNRFEIKNSILINEFNTFVRENPEFAARIPDQALVVMLLEEDAEFSQWNRQNAQRMAEKNRPIVFIHIKNITSQINDVVEKLPIL